MPESKLELRTSVNEQVHDDFLVAGRHLGFSCRADFLRYLVNRELYGVTALYQVTKRAGAMEERKS